MKKRIESHLMNCHYSRKIILAFMTVLVVMFFFGFSVNAESSVITLNGDEVTIPVSADESDDAAVCFTPDATGGYQLNLKTSANLYGTRIRLNKFYKSPPGSDYEYEGWNQVDSFDFYLSDADEMLATNGFVSFEYNVYLEKGNTYKFTFEAISSVNVNGSNQSVSITNTDKAGIYNGLIYSVYSSWGEDEVIRIVKYVGSNPSVTVPAKIAGYKVNELSSSSFSIDTLTSLTLEEGITFLDNSAINYCENLEKISFPKTLNRMYTSFSGCPKLSSIEFPNGSEYFYVKDKMLVSKKGELIVYFGESTEKLIIPNGVNKVTGATFEEKGVKNLVLPYSVTELSGNPSSLEEMHIANPNAQIYYAGIPWDYDPYTGEEYYKVKVYAPKGGTVETYCKENNITFIEEGEAYDPQKLHPISEAVELKENVNSIVYVDTLVGTYQEYIIKPAKDGTFLISSYIGSYSPYEDNDCYSDDICDVELYDKDSKPVSYKFVSGESTNAKYLKCKLKKDETYTFKVSLKEGAKLHDGDLNVQYGEYITDFYTVTYDLNGGYWGTTWDDEKNESVNDYSEQTFNVTIGSAIGDSYVYGLEHEGNYILEGWTIDGDDTLYVEDGVQGDGQVRIEDFVPEDDVTFHAKWAECISVTFDANGGTFPEETTSKTVKVSKGNTYNYYTGLEDREGFVFIGWKTDGDDNLYVEDFSYNNTNRLKLSDYVFNKNTTFTAQWAEAYRITFVSEEGYISGNEETSESYYDIEKGEKFKYYIECYSRPGYVFTGWKTEGDDTLYIPSIIMEEIEGMASLYDYIADKDTVFVAQWVKGYTATWDGNGGYVDAEWYDEECEYIAIKDTTIAENTEIRYSFYEPLEREGYIFKGYKTEGDDTLYVTELTPTSKLNEGEEYIHNYVMKKDTVFVAQWEKISVAENENVNKVIGLISGIGKVTKDSKSAIDAARAAYNGLSESDKALVKNYATLQAAEQEYEKLIKNESNNSNSNSNNSNNNADNKDKDKQQTTPNQPDTDKKDKDSALPKKGAKVTSKDGTANYTVTGSTKENGKSVATVTYTSPLGKNKKNKKISITSKVVLSDGNTAIVTKIADNAFASNKKITSVVIPKTVKSIGKKAFYNCTKLTSVKIQGDSLVSIDASAFQGCTSLKNITIPAKVKTIGAKAFFGCKKLSKVTIKSTVLKSVGSNAFKSVKSNITFKCPKNKIKKYTSLITKAGAPKKAKYK